MIDLTNGKLSEALAYAKDINDKSLFDCLDKINKTDKELKTVTTIYNDFAPYSFEFARKKDGMFCGNGGIIYHGKHDGYGSGSSPVFSVSITPAKGWQIHT